LVGDYNVIWLYAGGAKWHKTFDLHKRLLKARKMDLNANPHLRKPNVSTSFYYEKVYFSINAHRYLYVSFWNTFKNYGLLY
jgi:hypothetical protein